MRDKARPFDEWYEQDPSGCWLWTGAVNSSGYANKYFQGRMETAHRISWLLNKGEIPEGLSVLHSCDTRHCVNPDHLFLGTQRENLSDMARKGRSTSPLTEEQVRQIRSLRTAGKTLQAIGDLFGVRKQTISNIVNGNTWGHLV